AVGSISFSPDPEDAVSRRERLVYGYRGALYPSLAFAAARALAPERFGGDVAVTDDVLRTAGESIPLDRGRMLIRWRGPFRDVVEGRGTYRTLTAYGLVHSYEQVLTGEAPEVSPESLKGKIVLIAPTAAGLLDLRANPFQGNEPGVFLHATILDNLLRGDYLRRAPGWANVGAVAAAALGAAAVVAAIPSATLASLAGLIVLLLSAALASGAFVLGFWLDLAPPIFAGALAFGGTMAMNYMTEGRDKRRVRDLFSRYVSPEYVRQLADDYQALKLGGERIPLTLLFSDIRGFTSISEKLPAEMVVQMLNEYLERMAEVVFRHGGTLDKFIGDAVMAFWGAPVRVPDHARRAAETALDMIEELEKLNQKWAAEGATARLNIGIGINTGEAVVGNIGSLSHKLDYTAIGDTVNLASRLEGLNKEYGTRIIVSETARAALGADYEVRPLDEVKVKGKEQAVKIYELLGRRSAAAPARAVALSLVAALLFASAGDLHGQAKARWTDMVYRPGSWRGAQVVPHPTSNDATDTLALVAQVETFSKPPRWRAEVRKIEDGKTLGQALVLIGDGKKIVVLTGLGSTPLGRHAAAKDPLVQAVAKRFDARGQPAQRGAARIVDRDAAGQVERVVLRRPAPRADFPDNLLSAGGAGRLGRSLLAVSMSEIGGKEREEVAATAGARGVARVRTVDGEITVMPDTAAVLLLEGMQVSVIDLDEFLRKARLGVYRAPVKKEEKP
ncbi:MAG: adenylate/guanylate cyclase domain-containing protein, partial [Gemmatimonadetes bacterium]|nr:adenylate/guanylate cyclase domain-containing protein [Gemmatimonadota bacterium]